MNSTKILSKKFYFVTLIVSILTMGFVTGCSDEDSTQISQYGYVQFKLYKDASFNESGTTRSVDILDKLNEAKKLEVVLQHKGYTISQTLVLNAYNEENAEFGLRSDKLELMIGDYTIIGFHIYDKLDNKLMSGSTDDNMFTVTDGGLIVKELSVNVTPRGMASFKLIKDFANTRATDDAYPFSKIKLIDISVKNMFTQEITKIESVLVSYKEEFKNGSADNTLYPNQNAETSYATCDTMVWLKAGSYQICGYTTYSDKKGKNLLESTTCSSKAFVVKDNELTEAVEVPIKLSETAEYIKDYIALKEIWEALGGPNWSYHGEAHSLGINWNFNKDIDMWGDQPGVGLDANGRITSLSLSGFGARGVIPDAIGQLTELATLYLGSHDELYGGMLPASTHAIMTAEEKLAARMDFDTRFRARDVREGLSDILKDAINNNPSMRPIKSQRINKKDVMFGNLTNRITGISKAIMRLTNLEIFYISNSPITSENFFVEVGQDSPFYNERNEWSWTNFDILTDLEIYNCPNLTSLPTEMLCNLPAIAMLNISCNSGISGEQLKADWEAIIDGASGDKIQVLYMAYNNLIETPSNDYLKRMHSLAFLDLESNQLEKIHPFGKEIYFAKLYLDHNKLTEIPHDENGYFFGFSGEMETFTCSNNRIKVFPNIFNAKSVYLMGSIDFSYNQISEFEDGENHRGVNVSEINLSNNLLKTFPGILFKTKSGVNSLNLAGNGMEEIPEGSLTSEEAYSLVSLDLSYNKLSDLPTDFYPTNLPYLYGVDVSYNCFSEFPYEPLNSDRLTVFGIRHQRDEEGNRILRTWPTGVYQCPSLVALYLGSNDIRKVEDTISPYIRILEIKDNPNISIDMSEVCSYIQAGYYTLIYDYTQDIRGCSILNVEN